jgi:Methyltransferase domain
MVSLQETREALSAACPEWVAGIWRSLRGGWQALFHRSKSMESTFFQIYENKSWGEGESVSGPGSDLSQTAAIREALPSLLREIGARSMVDAPCGDFHWMKDVELGLDRYIGIDIVAELVDRNRQQYADSVREFRALNITQEPVPNADVIFCRDCLVHLSYSDIAEAVRNFKKSGSTYLLTTTFVGPRKNRDIVTGDWRPLNLQRPPWNFPQPVAVIDERCTLYRGQYQDKVLGLWRLSDLSV